MRGADLKSSRRLPALTCGGCGTSVVLPYRDVQGSDFVEPYWPEGCTMLAWVCDQCRAYTDFLQTSIHWVPYQATVEQRGFWRVEMLCSDRHCTATIVAHTQTFGMTSRRDLALAIARGVPTPCCALGHPPSVRPYPERLDFIEWTGQDDYVV